MDQKPMPQDLKLAEIEERARQAAASRRFEEAARFWEMAVKVDARHAEALYFLGQHALNQGRLDQARDYLDRAAAIWPDNPSIPLCLSYVARKRGDAAAELAALDRAIAIDSYFYPAHLAKGTLLERVGQKKQAAMAYKKLAAVLPPRRDLPKEFRAAVDHAEEVVQANARELDAALETRLKDLRARHGDLHLNRFNETKDIAVGLKKAFVARPLVLQVPQLPAIQFFDESEFECLAAFSANTEIIRGELLDVMGSGKKDFRPYLDQADGTTAARSGLNRSMRWSAYFLWKDGKKIEEHCRACPRTAELLAGAGMPEIPGFAPTAFFSVLEPHTRIDAHTGATNARVIVHIPLIVPPHCAFRVGNETREWRAGTPLVFDDTIEHEAWNDSDETRVVLIFDLWNPFLTVAERELVRELLNGIDDYYRNG